jgi:hypothetical protein
MTNDRYSRPLAAALKASAWPAIALLFLVSLDFSSDGASAQNRRAGYRDQPYTPAPATVAVVPAPQVEAPKQIKTPQIDKMPQIDPASPFGGALASCDKGVAEEDFGLPGLKGEVKLDRCYRGRKQLVCRFDAVLAEGKSLTDEFTRIVEQRYPEVNNLEEICKLDFDALVKDSTESAEFGKRFAAERSEYDARAACANKVKQSVQDVTLPDLVQAPEVIKSLIEAVDNEVNRVSVVQEQVSGLAAKIDASQRSIAVLQKIHRAMCLKSKPDAEADRGRVSSNM